MSNVVIDLTKTVKEIITTMKTAIDNLNTDMGTLKSEILLAAHPVGSYYISDNATDPGTLFGGTWKMLDPGLTLISQGKGTDKFGSFEFVAGQTYGERMHQLTVDELAKHTHAINHFSVDTAGSGIWVLLDHESSREYWQTFDIKTAGNDAPHNNVQPSKAVYTWFRVS